MVGYEHPVRTCFFRWAIDSPYPRYSIHVELVDVLGLHLPPCVCAVHFASVRFLGTRSRDVNVRRLSMLLSTLRLCVGICQRHST